MSGDAAPAIDAARAIADLRELDARTGGPEGARRVCWTGEWHAARELLAELLDEVGLRCEVDEAGNAWTYLEGEEGSEPALAVGSHLDSVPNGGWLDGALGVMAAVALLRAWAGSGRRPRRTLALVDWADEEGAFGRSLLGSSAASGTLDPGELASARDRDGRPAADVLAANGVELEGILAAASRMERLGAYLELHIEQGPVLASEGVSAAAVSGCVGLERVRFRFAGAPSHAGTTPMDARRDAGLAAATTALAVERIATAAGGVGTVGSLALEPGAPTVIPGVAELVADLRHPDAEALAGMLAAVRDAAETAAAERGCELAEEPVWRIEPIAFDPDLVLAARRACERVAGRDYELSSGALHDAAEAARRVPAAMVFSPSIGGISHSPAEDTAEADLRVAIEAFGQLANGRL
ncbi:MAG TPA: Zn-dependent hydrolase [Solirubrobacterales bacterium]|nr:Zn-dependent hydrolase [Solirubrobacterales bacterium]